MSEVFSAMALVDDILGILKCGVRRTIFRGSFNGTHLRGPKHNASFIIFPRSGVYKNTNFGEIKQYKSMVILTDFPYNNALFGLVSYFMTFDFLTSSWDMIMDFL